MRNYCRLITCFVLLYALPGRAYTQNTKQSLFIRLLEAKHDTARVLALLDYGDSFFDTDYDSTEYYFSKAKSLIDKIGYRRGYHKYVSYQSGIYNMRGEFDKNRILCREGLEIARKQGDIKSQGVHLSNIGNSYLYQGNLDSAAWYLVSSSKMFELVKDSTTLGQVYGNITTLFDLLKQHDQALYYGRQSLRLALANNDRTGVGYAYNNIGVALKKKLAFDSAAYYFNMAYPIARESGAKDLELTVVVNLGFMANQEKDLETSDRYFERALKLSEELQHMYGIVSAKKGLATNNVLRKNYEKAITQFQEAIELASANGLNSELSDIYRFLYEASSQNKNYSLALDAYQKHIHIRDSLNNVEIQKNIAALEKQYQSERKEKLLLLKDTQIKSQQLLLQSKNTWIWILSTLIAVVALIAFLLWKIQKQKKLQAVREQQIRNMKLDMQVREEERHRIARELHDDLGGSLSGIIVQSHYMKQQVEHHNVTALQKSLEKISQESTDMITRLNDIIWLVNPKFDTLEKLVQRIEEFANDMAVARGMDVRIDSLQIPGNLELNTQARKNIYLICKEAINNAVKYSQASELYLSIAKKGEDLNLLIKDNGKGFDQKNIREGNGLLSMKERASSIGATYSIDADAENGTRVSLNYKIPQ